MTVRELIEELKKFPGDMQVLVDGYEYGFDPVKALMEMELIQNPSDYDFEGKYLDSGDRKMQMCSWMGPIPEQENENQQYRKYLVIKANRGANAE